MKNLTVKTDSTATLKQLAHEGAIMPNGVSIYPVIIDWAIIWKFKIKLNYAI